MKPRFGIVGKTPKGFALSGVFRLVDTHGIPLDLIDQSLREQGHAVAWDHYVAEALAHGWSRKSLNERLLAHGLTPEQLDALG